VLVVLTRLDPLGSELMSTTFNGTMGLNGLKECFDRGGPMLNSYFLYFLSVLTYPPLVFSAMCTIHNQMTIHVTSPTIKGNNFIIYFMSVHP
jgi:hypothetical protein